MERSTAKYEYNGLKCIGCSIVFDSKTRNKKQRYCTKKCAAKYLINNGRFGSRPAWNKGLIGYNKGYPRTQEWKDKISSANKGENAPNWKGGISKENELIRKSREYINWRNSVFERDDYTCQNCGARSAVGNRVRLHADHIKPFALHKDLRFELTNGRTLCVQCHRKTETYGMSMIYQKDYSNQKAVKL